MDENDLGDLNEVLRNIERLEVSLGLASEKAFKIDIAWENMLGPLSEQQIASLNAHGSYTADEGAIGASTPSSPEKAP